MNSFIKDLLVDEKLRAMLETSLRTSILLDSDSDEILERRAPTKVHFVNNLGHNELDEN